MISEEDINRVREASDLVSIVSERVVLKQRGRLYWGCCPFHHEKTPSFKVDPATQLWHCFGCSEGGDVFGYIMRMENLDFPDAIRALADRANIEIVETGGSGVSKGAKSRLKDVCKETAAFYHQTLMRSKIPEAAQAREYLAKRGFGSEVAKRWSLGYAPGREQLAAHLTQKGFTAQEIISANVGVKGKNGRLNDRFFGRVMFPINDLQGATIAFGGRVVGKGEPKYLNSQETPIFHKSNNMYAIDRAKDSIVSQGTALVVEGYTDVIALHEAGITNVVATLGTALTQQHVKLLSRFAKRIVYVFDGDEAGKRAADRASGFIDGSLTPESGSVKTELLVAMLPADKDPADYIAEKGAEGFNTVIKQAVPLLEFSINRRIERWNLEVPEEKARALNDAVEVLAPIKKSILADEYINYIAGKLQSRYELVKAALDSARPVPQYQNEPEPKPSTAPFTTGLNPPGVRHERELLSLLVAHPFLRDEKKDEFSDIPWSIGVHKDLARVILSQALNTSAATLFAVAGNMIPDAQSILTTGTIETTSDDETLAMARFLVRLIREDDLERRIQEGNFRLKSSKELSQEEYDNLFQEITVLQKELKDLRSRS